MKPTDINDRAAKFYLHHFSNKKSCMRIWNSYMTFCVKGINFEEKDDFTEQNNHEFLVGFFDL